MKKIGRRGFMLAEVVVVSIVVSTVLITLFNGVSNVASAYEVRNRYYDVDSIYVAIETNEILKRTGLLTLDFILRDPRRLDKDSTGKQELNNYMTFYKNSTSDTIRMYISGYTNSELELLKSTGGNNNLTFKDYIDYLKNNLDFEDDRYNYMIIVERRENDDNDDCYYYALKLKYS